MSVSKPKRIINPPTKIKSRGGKALLLECDNGKEYLLKDLCELLGIKYQTLLHRLRNNHWSSKKILQTEKIINYRKNEVLPHIKRGDLCHLSGSRRAKYPEFTEIEREILEKC